MSVMHILEASQDLIHNILRLSFTQAFICVRVVGDEGEQVRACAYLEEDVSVVRGQQLRYRRNEKRSTRTSHVSSLRIRGLYSATKELSATVFILIHKIQCAYMVQRRQYIDLLLNLFHIVLIPNIPEGQNFACDLPVRASVDGEVNCGEGAASESV